jgi:hypothetical protein
MGTGASTQTLEKTGRRIPRTRTIGVRVTEQEYRALEAEPWKARKTVADWSRDQILDGHGSTVSVLLMNTSLLNLSGFSCS